MNKLRQIQFGLVLFCCILIQGCATILSPEKGPYMLNSEPTGAEVIDDKGRTLGNTPYNMKTMGKSVKSVTIRKAGYRESELRITRTTKNGYVFLDAMLLCIPCIIDFSNDNIETISPKNGTVKLRKEATEHDQNIKVAIDKVTLSKSISSTPGKINSHPKTLDDHKSLRYLGNSEDMDQAIIEAMQKSYLSATDVYYGEKDKSGLSMTKILIKTEITELSFDLQGSDTRSLAGAESMKCKWGFYKMSDKNTMIGSTTTSVSLSRIKGSTSQILVELMQESVLDLLESDTLYPFLQKIERDYLSETKGSELRIKGPNKTTYGSTKDMLKASKTGVVTVLTKDGFGSGIIISEDGYVLTNYHVTEGQKDGIQVKLNGDVKLKATIVKSNRDYDLALLKIEADELKSLPLGNSTNVESGDDVWAIGTPLETSLGQTITKGIVSGLRTINGLNFIQTDVSINSGNSGGPILNEKGEVIGITTMKLKGEGIEGIGFCIPSNTAVEMLNLKF